MRHLAENVIFMGILSQIFLQASFEDQREESQQKTDRFGWWDGDPWLPEPQPPVPVGPPPPRPGPARPPAPLDQSGARPPAPLDQSGARPPAPLAQSSQGNRQEDHVTRSGAHAEEIQCVRRESVTLLSAVVVPPADFSAPPVFEDAGGPQQAECAMRPTEGGHRTFAMHVQHFAKCGVRVQQGADGKEWISVTIRFPFMEGLRMAEDEYVMVMCRPQDRIATTHHVMDLRGSAVEGRSVQQKKVFRSGPRDVACRMQLMTRTQGSRTKEMKSGATVRVGQELQIRGIVREGDGWNYAMLRDVVVSRVSGNRGSGSDVAENAIYRDHRTTADDASQQVAQLVFNDGCRNPAYRPVAPFHPQRDPQSPLVVSFAFKAFMFQDMLDGESLRLSAQVVACAELTDCQLAFCNGEAPRGRQRRSVNGSAAQSHPHIKNFTEDFQLSVTLGGFSKSPVIGPTDAEDWTITPGLGGDCKLALMSVGGAALVFCLGATAAAAITLGNARKTVAPSHKELKKCLQKCSKPV